MASALPDFANPECIDAICFDMDGVLADLFGQPDWCQKLDKSQASPYFAASPLVDTEYLNEIVQIFEDYLSIPTFIISWGSKECDWYFDRQVEKVKKYWLSAHLPAIADENIFVVPYGTDKSSIVADYVSYPVLFDDTASNCENWWWENSVIIDPECSAETIFPTLQDLFNCIADEQGITHAPVL